MIVEQAVYGEVKGGHGLRATSSDRALATGLASRLDLPDTAPPGADWSPFVSGFPYHDWYVIACTFRDPNATRAGMVLSHALIISIDAIIATADLRPIFGMLITEPKAPANLSTLNITPSESPPPVVSELLATAAALVTRGTAGPVVRVGHQGFDALVASLWGQLWPTLRRGFSFRLSFGPRDLVEDPPPALVCTPKSLAARWQGYRLLDRYASSPASLASSMLNGDGMGEPLRAFADQIGAESASFGDLSLLEQAYRFTVLEPGLIGSTLAAIRLTERLSPDPSRGEAGKGDLIDRLILQLENANPNDILQLRNLQLQGFTQTERVWKALAQRVASGPFQPAHDAAFLNIMTDAFTADKASEEWRGGVLEGLLGAARRGMEAFPSALWRWVEADPALTEPLWTHLGMGKVLEERLVQVAPQTLGLDAVQPILVHAVEEGLYLLHGAAAAAAYTPIEAVRLQVSVEPPSSSEGVKLALRRATPAQVVECAIDIDDRRLIQLAADAAAKTPELLAKIEMSNKVARAIWSAALNARLDVWRGPGDPRAAFDTILIDFLDGVEVPLELIDRLSQTPLGDLNAFPRRTELWPKLTSPARNHLLRATGAAWLQDAETGRELSSVEPALGDAILGDLKLDTLLERLATGHIERAAHLVTLLDGFDETRFRYWLRCAAGRTCPIPPTDAEAIGRLASKRHWQGVADDLIGMLQRGRDDVRPALRTCISLVGFFHRFLYSLSQVTPSEKWDALAEIASEFYPTGPDHDGLWERAGGRDTDLDWSGNGRSRWRNALARIRRGGGPCVKTLLREMQNDYPANTELRYLAEDREFGRHR
jgi:hypothetical protein